MSETTIYRAAKIFTMNPHQPVAEAVAVRHDRIVGVSTLGALKGAGKVDERFADKVLLPGFVEGHTHIQTGTIWANVYVGYHDRLAPDGKLWAGLKSFDEVVARLREVAAVPPADDRPLLAWGFDPVFLGERRMTVAELDRVSTTRPVIIMHQTFHALNVNSVVLDRAGITGGADVEGIVRDAGGKPTGELREVAVMKVALQGVGANFNTIADIPLGIWNFGRIANMTGATTVTDLANELSDAMVDGYCAVTANDDFPARIVPMHVGWLMRPSLLVERLAHLATLNTSKLHFGRVKLVVDGAFSGFTARLKPPGYYNGAPNGVWNFTGGQLRQQMELIHECGYQLHIHTNGDEATDLAIDVLREIISKSPRADHRHTLQHCQLANAEQFQKMIELGLCTNLFSNHIYYYGDLHYATTLGPERSARMNAAATAKRLGVHFSIHSDSPVTPIAPLFTAWCAVNRLTAGGRVLGTSERLSVADALHAITLGAAYTLRLDHEIGSIEMGKRADFAVLDENPYAVDPASLKDVRVSGTVLGGRHFPAPGSPP